MSRLDNDRDLYLELVKIFFDEAPSLLLALDRAVKQSDSKLLQVTAHTIKGAASNVGAIVVQATAFGLEQLGRSGQSDGAGARVEELKRQVEDFRQNFDQYTASLN